MPTTKLTNPTNEDAHLASPTRLNPAEQQELQQLEHTIAANLTGTFELAAALMKIRDQKLYRVDHHSFEDYCRKRWDYSPSYCHRLAQMNEVMIDLKTNDEIAAALPRNESQARIFNDLAKNERIQLAEKAQEETGDHPPTAKLYQRFKKELFPEKCAPKPKLTVIDVAVVVKDGKPSLQKLMEHAIKLSGVMLPKEREGVLGELLQRLVDDLQPWVDWEASQQ